MNYLDKLKTTEWKLKRDEILNRDSFTCSSSKNVDFSKKWVETYDEEGNLELFFYDKESHEIIQAYEKTGSTISIDLGHDEYLIIPIMNVHHKKYILNKEPWDYDNNDLVTLCSECHKKLHELESIPLYNNQGMQIDLISKCPRCGGYGYIPKYSHVQNGICFNCWGEGIDISLLVSRHT